MKQFLTFSILLISLLFSFPAFSSGGGTGPGAKQFLEESEQDGDANVSGQYVELDQEEKVVFNLKYKKKSKRFIVPEDYLADQLPQVLDALVRSQNQGSTYQVIE